MTEAGPPGLIHPLTAGSTSRWLSVAGDQRGSGFTTRLGGCAVRFPNRAGPGIRLLEEDLAMRDHTPAPGDADDHLGSESDLSHTAEFAKMRAVMRASEKHREGGLDPELEVPDADPDPET
jgi:hypothetical protein